MRTSESLQEAFYDTIWFKLFCLFVFFGWMFYMIGYPYKISQDKLVPLNAIIAEQSKAAGSRNPIKLSFITKDYKSRFGIYVGGIFGRITEVKNALQPGSDVTIKIHQSDVEKLQVPTEIIPIYY